MSNSASVALAATPSLKTPHPCGPIPQALCVCVCVRVCVCVCVCARARHTFTYTYIPQLQCGKCSARSERVCERASSSVTQQRLGHMQLRQRRARSNARAHRCPPVRCYLAVHQAHRGKDAAGAERLAQVSHLVRPCTHQRAIERVQALELKDRERRVAAAQPIHRPSRGTCRCLYNG